MPTIRIKNPLKINEEKRLQKLEKKNKLKELKEKALELNSNANNKIENFNSKIDLFEQIDNENIIKAQCDIEVNPNDKSIQKVNCKYQLLKIQKPESKEIEVKEDLEI